MDINAWLRDLGLEQYARAFEDNGVDDAVLPRLDAEDLKEIGVRQVGHRRKLLDAIAALQSGAPSSGQRPRPAEATHDGERRQVTVLFADLAGFTRLSTELDAEDLHAVRSAFSDTIDQIVADHGGAVERHIGDCVMGVFGAPLAHDNDPERAVLAATAIVEAMPPLAERLARPIAVHVGVASGEVLATGIGGGAHRVFTVTGESVNLASRLTSQAREGEILMSAAVQRALASRVEAIEVDALSVKGFAEPVPAYRLVSMRQAPVDSDHPFVGRQAELRQLSAALTACLETSTGQTIHIRGEAGIGKSRLVQELLRLGAANGFACHTSQVLDFGVGRGQEAIRALVRSLVGLKSGMAQEAAGAMICSVAATPDCIVFLNELLDLPQPPELRALYDAMDNATRTQGVRETAAQMMGKASREKPLLLVIEDVHWADEATLESIAVIAETVSECRALLVLTARLDGHMFASRWAAHGPSLTIDLAPLRHQEALALAGTFSQTWSEYAERCIERAAGNPLFLEQLLRHAGDRMGSSVPDSVQSLVQARMDRLDPAEKQALQAAAIFGQRFTLEGLRSVLRQSAYDIRALVATTLVRAQGEDYGIGHALIRDAVYATLPHSRRRELHAAAAAWFASRDLSLQAEHLDRADDPHAPQAYLAAARQQARLYRYEPAITLADRGAALAQDALDKAALACCRGDLLLDVGKTQEARAAYEAALAIAPDDVHRCRAWLGLAGVKRIIDDIPGALEDVTKAEELASQLGLKEDEARAHFLRANLFFASGDVDNCLRHHKRSLALARELGSAELEAAAIGGLADAEFMRGHMISAAKRFHECIALAERGGFGRIAVANRPITAFARYYSGDVRGALDDVMAALTAAGKVGHRRAKIIAHMSAYTCKHALMDMAGARQHAEWVLKIARHLGSRRFEARGLSLRAELHALAGDAHEALADLQQALSISREVGMAYGGAMILATMARLTDDPVARHEALAEGEQILGMRSASHNHLFFRSEAIDACLAYGEWDEAERHAGELEAFLSEEPLVWSDFMIARARALVAHGRGKRDAATRAEFERLIKDGERYGYRASLPMMQLALADVAAAMDNEPSGDVLAWGSPWLLDHPGRTKPLN